MKKLLTIAALILAVSFSPSIVRAADEKPAEAPKKELKPRALPFTGKISAVDKSAKTITLEGKEKSRTFQITSATRINKEKKPATLDDAVVGEYVGGATRENAEGKAEVITLNLGIQPRAAKAKGGEKKEAK